MESCFVELTGIGTSHLNKEEIDENDLEDREAIIETEYSLISAGTELSRAFAIKKGFRYPVRPGYCGVGKILKKGNGIDAEIGDRVFFNAPHASKVRWKDSDDVQGPLIRKLSKDIDPIEATAMNLLLVALQGVNLTQVKLGYDVGVFGLGNIGIMTALMYQKMGCRVIGIDPIEGRRKLAESMGLRFSAGEDKKEKIETLTRGKGLDIAADVTGLPEAIIDCISFAGKDSQVLLLGSPRKSYETDLTPVFSGMHMKDLKVIGAFNKTIPVREKDGSRDCMDRNFRICEDLIRNRDIDISRMITKVIDPSQCQEAYDDLMYHKDRASFIVYDWRNY